MILDTPNVTRADDWSCGRVALEVLAGHHGVPVPLEYLDLANAVRGLSDETAEAIVRRLFPFVALGHWELDDLEHHTRLGRPVMCLVTNESPADHWVVVRGIDRKAVYYHDARGRGKRPRERFRVWWEGPAENPLRNFALVGWPGGNAST